MKFEEITFVIQGLINPSVTKQSINTLKKIFPGSSIIISTWEGQDADDIGSDLVVYNKDPGSTVFVYSKKDKPVYININRKIVSSFYGLSAVKTKYAAKLRSDNVLYKTDVIKIFERFPMRSSELSFFNERLVCSNFYAKEFEKGLRIPFFFSDFFQFGETEDLLTLWSPDLYQDYEFRPKLSGKKQHENYPNDSVHVEQRIWSNLVSKFTPTELKDEHGNSNENKKSYDFMINNLIVVDGDILGLKVPERLQQSNDYPYEFLTFRRWKWLYSKEFGVEDTTPLSFKLKWYFSTLKSFLKSGVRLKLRKYASQHLNKIN